MITAGQPGPARRSLAALAAVLLLVVGAMVLVIAAAHVTPTGYAQGRAPAVHIGGGIPRHLPTLPKLPGGQPAAQHASNTLNSTAVLAIIGLALAFFAAALSAVVRTVGVSRRHRFARQAGALGFDAGSGGVEQITAAVESGIGELDAERPARDSIIACWQRLGAAAADAGIAPVPSDTPEQAIERVLAARGVRAEPLRALAELYREARFSRHAMAAAAVEAARDALGAILTDLRQGANA